MLKTVFLTDKGKEAKTSGCVMLLGGFDGLHLGHRGLLARARDFGLPVGIMTISDGKATGQLFTFEEREEIFSRVGADIAFELPFAEIKELSPQAFLQLLLSEFAVKAFVCGEDFRFGKGAVGNAKNIKEYTRVRVETEKLVEIDGEKASATRVKAFLADGDMPSATKILCEPYFLIGEVEKDRGVGRTIGFPTANIRYPENKFKIKQGVYETQVRVDGVLYKGVTNYGARPTFSDGSIWTETHLIGFTGELYGKKLTIEFLRYLRGIQGFGGVEQLKAQLKEDVRRVTEND